MMDEKIHPQKDAIQVSTPPAHSLTASGSDEVVMGDIENGIANDNKLQRWANKLDATVGMEARGIERVPESLREPTKPSASLYANMFLIWLAMNCTANQMTVGILGPVAYGLNLTDSIVICLFGTLFGAAWMGYISTFGPISGLRTLIVAKYTMGWWPSKICVVLNIVIEVGYGLVDCLVAGLILSAVNGDMSVIVGIVVVAIISWIVATFGIRWFHTYEKYFWIPTVLVLFILIGCAGPKFDTTSRSTGSGAVLVGNRLSYFFLTASLPLGWTSSAADYYSYYPATTSRWMTFAVTAGGTTIGKLLIEAMGIGLGSGMTANPAWAEAFGSSRGVGALILAAFEPLGTFGHFCAVLLALSIIANMVPGVYSLGLNFQMFGAPWAKVPRIIWSTFGVLISMVCAIAGREKLLTIFLNFLSIIGYWVIIWVTMTLQEELIFRRKTGFDWTAWNKQRLLPVGYAAFLTFLVGWAGAIVSMSQTYYTGPIGAMVGHGADLGLPVAMAFTAVVYPGLRYLELKHLGR